MIGRNLRPFCAHMTSYFFFFLAQALSAARRFCLASTKVSLCLELGPGSEWTTVVSNKSPDILPSGLSGTNGRVVGFLPSCLTVDSDKLRTVQSPRLLQSNVLVWKIPRSSLVEHMPATLSIDWISRFNASWVWMRYPPFAHTDICVPFESQFACLGLLQHFEILGRCKWMSRYSNLLIKISIVSSFEKMKYAFFGSTDKYVSCVSCIIGNITAIPSHLIQIIERASESRAWLCCKS